MANLPENSTFDAGVYQIETTDPVQGGVNGVTNTPLKNLVNRTRYLYDQVTTILATIAAMAGLNSPAFTGTPTCPTKTPGDDSNALSSTGFVQVAAGGAATVDCSGGSNVVLTAAQWGARVIILIGALTANINVIFPTRNDEWTVINRTTGGFGITCKTAGGSGMPLLQGKGRDLVADATNVVYAMTDFQNADLTGAPTADTPANGDASRRVATTAFVQLNSAGGRPWSFKGADYQLVAKDRVVGLTTDGLQHVLTLPANPAQGDELVIKGNYAAVNWIVARNGQTIDGNASDLTLNKDRITLSMVFDGATWRV